MPAIATLRPEATLRLYQITRFLDEVGMTREELINVLRAEDMAEYAQRMLTEDGEIKSVADVVTEYTDRPRSDIDIEVNDAAANLIDQHITGGAR